jgi:hypothetical protein
MYANSLIVVAREMSVFIRMTPRPFSANITLQMETKVNLAFSEEYSLYTPWRIPRD